MKQMTKQYIKNEITRILPTIDGYNQRQPARMEIYADLSDDFNDKLLLLARVMLFTKLEEDTRLPFKKFRQQIAMIVQDEDIRDVATFEKRFNIQVHENQREYCQDVLQKGSYAKDFLLINSFLYLQEYPPEQFIFKTQTGRYVDAIWSEICDERYNGQLKEYINAYCKEQLQMLCRQVELFYGASVAFQKRNALHLFTGQIPWRDLIDARDNFETLFYLHQQFFNSLDYSCIDHVYGKDYEMIICVLDNFLEHLCRAHRITPSQYRSSKARSFGWWAQDTTPDTLAFFEEEQMVWDGEELKLPPLEESRRYRLFTKEHGVLNY